MNKIIIFVLAASVAFLSFSWKTSQDHSADRQQLLMQVGSMLEKQHYLAPAIDDSFSIGVWDAFINTIDTRKYIFLQTDVEELKAYNKYLDNEIHGDSIKFFPATIGVFTRRYEEAAAIYRDILSQPFTFTDKDSITTDSDTKTFPGDNNDRIRKWTNLLKYMTLDKLIELQELRTNSKKDDTTYHKTDAQLEQQARAIILRQYNRTFSRFRSYNEDKLFSLYLNVITHYVDPHSDYFPPLEKKAFDQSMAVRFYGIGAQLREEDGNIRITGIEPGSPAWKSEVFTVNDILVKVGQGSNGALTDITGMALEDAVKLIRGDKGSVVRIEFKKTDGTLKTVSLVREEIKQEDAFARSAVMTSAGKKTGYIYLPLFYDDFAHADGAHCAADVAAEVAKLKAENVSNIIIDLRNNGGGSLGEVIKMVGLFIGSGPVVQVKSGHGQPEVLRSYQAQPLYTGPLTVMVNEMSASASEIFAAAIQDYKRGIIIGSTTFGKGTVQRTIPFEQEEFGAVKLTLQKFYRINGGSTQMKGVIPDIVLPDTYETLKIREMDKPSALSWDKVQEAPYTIQSSAGSIDSLADLTAAGIAQKDAFKVIRTNNSLLEQYQDAAAHTFSLKQYRSQLLMRKKIAKQNEAAQELPKNERIDVKALPGAARIKEASFQKWMEKISADIYIDQALKIAG